MSPEFDVVEPIFEDGSGPRETIRSGVFVRAKNQRRAKVLALRWFRKQSIKYWWDGADWWNDGGNPFNGMLVEDISNMDRSWFFGEPEED